MTSAKARVGPSRRFQLWAIARLRRSRFLPAGIPDKVADVGRLGVPVTQPIMLFFATVQDSLYQIRPWYEALEALNARQPVIAVFKDSRTAAVVRAESGLDCVTIARYGQLDGILTHSDVKLALYLNHDPLNFEALRFTSMLHVYLGHGESDKGVSVSNQIKAYDYCFVAGQAAIDRIISHVMAYDADTRCIPIGQPAVAQRGRPDPRSEGATERRTVLYAPTWEGGQPSVSYGSLRAYGVGLVGSLIDSGSYRVIYRPHPLSGVIDADYGRADATIRELVRRAPGHRVDTTNDIADSFADADILICDVSAVSLTWLPSGKPLIITKPAATAAVGDSRLMQTVPLLDGSTDVVALVAAQFDAGGDATARLGLIDYYVGDQAPGAAIGKFITVCERMMTLRDETWSVLRSKGAVGP